MKGKKAQAITFENAPKMVLILVFLGLVVAAGITALSSFRTSSYTTESLTGDTHTASNTTYTFFADSTIRVVSCSGATFANGTNSLDVTSYFAVDNNTGCTALVSNDSFNGETITAAYTATVAGSASDAINNTMVGGNNFSDQLPTVGTMLGVGLILLVVIGVFASMALNKMGIDLK